MAIHFKSIVKILWKNIEISIDIQYYIRYNIIKIHISGLFEEVSFMSNKTNYEEKLNDEIEKRICEMENEKYEFSERFSAKDYIILTIVAAVALIILIVGAFI
jgi:hypothetical protein